MCAILFEEGTCGFASGPKLAQALRDQGTFAAVEATVRQIYRQQEQSKIEGGWHNSVTLSQLGWTECLGWHILAMFVGLQFVFHTKGHAYGCLACST